jgi:hypothetical protein
VRVASRRGVGLPSPSSETRASGTGFVEDDAQGELVAAVGRELDGGAAGGARDELRGGEVGHDRPGEGAEVVGARGPALLEGELERAVDRGAPAGRRGAGELGAGQGEAPGVAGDRGAALAIVTARTPLGQLARQKTKIPLGVKMDIGKYRSLGYPWPAR